MQENQLDLYKIVFDNLEDAVYLINNKGKTILANNATIKGYRCSRNLFEKLYSDSYKMLENGTIDHCIFTKVLETKEPVVGWNKIYDVNHKSSLYLIHQVPIFDADGEIKYVLGWNKSKRNIEKHYLQSQGTLKDYVHVKLQGSRERLPIIFRSKKMKDILDFLNTISKTDVSILLQGETGTGKEVLANYIHDHSKRTERDITLVNCAALSPSLFEAEMFGYTKGSFTGADPKGKAGIIEAADQSTLFLDEIDSLPMDLQGKLLRALETKCIQKIGDNKATNVDFRLITATNKDLRRAITEGRFREDLYYRLNVVSVTIPPLRERPEDIRPLAEYYLYRYCLEYEIEKHFDENVFQQLENYTWPGNVRELKHLIERTVLTSDISSVNINNIHIPNYPAAKPNEGSAAPLSEPIRNCSYSNTLDDRLGIFEKQIIDETLNSCTSTAEAAKKLGVSISTIERRMKKYNLSK